MCYYQNKEIAFCLYRSSAIECVPLYRYYDGSKIDHYYCIDRDAVQSSYESEASLGYAFKVRYLPVFACRE